MERLLAKSYDRRRHGDVPPDYALLTQHSRDVAAACNVLSLTVGRVALFNAGLNDDVFQDFSLTLRANGWMQDLGKASSHFQEMVTGEPQIRQLVRHETISGMLMWLEPRLRGWLSPLPEMMFTAAVWGAMGHHRKFDEQTSPGNCLALTVKIAHEDFATILAEMSSDLGLGQPPHFEVDLVIAQTHKEACDLPARESIRDLQDEFMDCEESFAGERARRMLALVKAFGIAADVAASAVAARDQWAKDYSLTDYVSESLRIGLRPHDLSSLINK
jgi:CRISPR-associated endonuclease/helicase Cas3